MFFKDEYISPIGKISIVCDELNLIGVWIGGQKYFEDLVKGKDVVFKKDNEVLLKVRDWLDRYFLGQKPDINEISIRFCGSSFQKDVWEILKGIPYGKTITYGQIAKMIAEIRGIKKFSAQAVGGAVGKNPISIIIPCHRVVGADGKLTGYAGGIDKKIALLEHEGIKINKKELKVC